MGPTIGVYGDHVTPDLAIDDPFCEDGPLGETAVTAIKVFEIDEIVEMINRGAA